MRTNVKTQTTLKARLFSALSDQLRLEILEFLRGGEKCVCEIIPHVQVAQPIVSRHLKILRENGLVKDRKSGNRRMYSITDQRIFNVIDAATAELTRSLSKNIIEQMA